jgi:hypothetical protein
MDSRTTRRSRRLSTSHSSPSAGDGAATPTLTLGPLGLIAIPDNAAPFASGGNRSALTDHARMASVLYARGRLASPRTRRSNP